MEPAESARVSEQSASGSVGKYKLATKGPVGEKYARIREAMERVKAEDEYDDV